MYKNQSGLVSYDANEVAKIKFEIEVGCKSIFVESWEAAILFCEQQYDADHTPPTETPRDGCWISNDSYITITPTDEVSVRSKYSAKDEIHMYPEAFVF
ncbi:hypothetical protein [Xanthocytophaga agilis]|uniref:Uncharacterized protein n=1 Tax=Xanthocytophaga agilis TaxID=3048010 RepID=A0AAE3QX72_9BACT|nr:hypothetical protein [Xanthocytophaga agilis]MDJ1499671.1 hypothetical protein [Xanthocytophaga agilis]